MRNLVLIVLLAGIALPVCAAKRVTVEQLEQVLASAHGKQDAKLAQQLSGLELTERLSPPRLSRLEAGLPGAESRRSLVVLADMSAFLDPPAAEIPAAATPDLDTQRQIMAMAVDYAIKAVHQLPNFFATRDTIRFEDSPAGQRPDSSAIPYVPLHAVGRFSDTVLYRDGREVVDSGAAKGDKSGRRSQGLTTSGEFGPILSTVLVDAAKGTLAWSHWEQGAGGPVAVFRYAIPVEQSHYQVEFCCVRGAGGDDVFKQYTGYHGQIAVNPANGTIRRLTLEADLKRANRIVRADILVEYGPVEIGGVTYICPVKSISISRAPTLASKMLDLRRNIFAAEALQDNRNVPLQTLLNDVAFGEYHVFRSEARVLTGDNTEQVGNAAAPESPGAVSAELPARAGQPQEASVVDNSAPAAPIESRAPGAPAAAAAAAAPSSAPPPAPPPEPAVAEMSVAEAAPLPDTAAVQSPASPGTGFTLRVTARLVDVGVVALDRKGHPVTDLKPEDFDVYDNGRKQTVRFFSRAEAAPAEVSANAAGQAGPPADQLVYSNRRADLADAKAGTGATESSVTILLIDAGSLAWADLSYAREQMLHFLEKLPAGERVGLYAQNARGFQILVEGTADHALLASALRHWMPSARDLAQAQQQETRNRQQFDEVLHPQDLQSVNGNTNTSPDTASTVDPQLRDFGRNPGRDALSILVGVARHLDAIPGHKNLVWVASDNVLASWTDQAVGADKGGKHLEGFVLRAQEALNDAQVSVYPLDASQLETQAVDASLANSSVELSPSVTAPPQLQGGGQAPGRMAAQMQQDTHPIQGAVQEMAEATGGRVFRRSGSIAANLSTVVADGRATYLLGFSPDTPANDQYHQLTVKLTGRRGVALRYRTGYLYARDPATLKDRLSQAIWQPFDAGEIAVSVRPTPAFTGATLKLNIAINDLALKLEGDRWRDKLDIFVVHQEVDGLHARITGRTLVLALQPATYQSLLEKGVPFDQFVERTQDSGSIRIVVVDENSGRIGSVTLPAAILQAAP